jgi:Zn-dependent protease
VTPELAQGIGFFVVFLLSTTLHEAGHAWAALKGGDPTAYLGGQVSLDPIPHIRREPFGMLILPLITSVTMGWPFGYASAPYDIRWARTHPRRAALMALAGPAANLTLLLLAFIALRVGAAMEIFVPPERAAFGVLTHTEASAAWDAAGRLLSIVFSLNLLLFVFNLLPVPPLDGSAAITLFMSRNVTRRYQEMIWGSPMLGFLGIFVAWQLFPAIFRPVFTTAISLIYPGASYG